MLSRDGVQVAVFSPKVPPTAGVESGLVPLGAKLYFLHVCMAPSTEILISAGPL